MLLFGVFLVALGGVSLFTAERAKAFLLGFATSPFKHFLEMTLRLLVGGSILFQAPFLIFSTAFTIFGWMMIISTAVLILIPWRWHRRFAETAVPRALRFLPVVGLVSVILGGCVLYSIFESLA